MEADALPRPRSRSARIGITFLNILQPGLGLLRLGKLRLSLVFLGAQLIASGLVLLRYKLAPTLTYAGWLVVILSVLIGLTTVYVLSMALTWRASRLIEVRNGWLWRWYGLVAVCIVIAVATIPLTEARRTYYRIFTIPAASMEPALRVGDLIVANMQQLGPLQRGDVVIVGSGANRYVKRIVALPGDRIEFGMVRSSSTVSLSPRAKSGRRRLIMGNITCGHVCWKSVFLAKRNRIGSST